jgi:hypothetical protein
MESKKKVELIKQIENYIIEVLEKPRSEFGGLPVCPFVKKERIKNSLMISVFDNKKENFLERMEEFISSKYTDAVFGQVLDDSLTTLDSKTYQNFLNGLLKQHFKQYKVIVTNPSDKMNVNGFNPRSLSPCFLIVVTDKKKLAKAHKQMMNSKYFTNFTEEYLNYLHVKKEDLNLK